MQYRHNGVLAYPEPVTSQICTYVQQTYAASLLHIGRKLGLREHWKWLKPILEKDAGDISVIGNPPFLFFTRSFRPDVSGLPSHYPVERLQEIANRIGDITVRVSVIDKNYLESKEPLGSWQPTNFVLTSNLSLKPVAEIGTDDRAFTLTPYSPSSKVLYQRYQLARKRICDTIEHEMRHFLQTLFVYMRTPHPMPEELLGSRARSGGIFKLSPAEQKKLDTINKFLDKYRGVDISTLPKSIQERIEKNRAVAYILDPVEFFPWIGNMQADILEDPRVVGAEDGKIPSEVMREWYFPKWEKGRGGRKKIEGGKLHMARLRQMAPTAYRRAVQELAAWSEDYNADLEEKRGVVIVTPQRVVSNTIERLEQMDSALAAYARLRRDKFERIAKEYLG